ncbi:12840_t:CDS:1, partial [Acaulospora colombiana]
AKLCVLFLIISTLSTTDLANVLQSLPKLSTLEVHVKNGVLVGNNQNVIHSRLSHLKNFSTCSFVASQTLGPLVDAPGLIHLTLEEQVGPKTVVQPDLWESCVSHCKLDKRISRLTLAGNTFENGDAQMLSKISAWTGVQHLNLRGTNQSPLLTAMTMDKDVLPNVTYLSLEGTDITGTIIQNLVNSRSHDVEKETKVGRIQTLVLSDCIGIDRAFCEDIVQRVDKLAVHY